MVIMENVFQILNNERNNLYDVERKTNDLNNEKNNEIRKEIDKLEKKYNSINEENLLEIKTRKAKLENVKIQIDKYSTFNKNMIGKILSKLMTIIEGKEYVFINAKHKTFERECTVFGSEIFETEKFIDLIIEKKYSSDYYIDFDETKNSVNNLVLKNRGILLNSSDYHISKMKFYNVRNNMYSTIDYKLFTYVKEYIDLIIDYRYKNEIEIVDKELLLKLLYEFVSAKKDLISEKYSLLMEEEKRRLSSVIEHEKKSLEEHKEEKIFISDTLLIDKLKNENDIKEINNFLNNIPICVGTNEGKVKTIIENELVSTNLMYIAKIKLNGIVKDCECGPWNDWYFVDTDINHDGILAVYDISNREGMNLECYSVSGLEYRSYIIKQINNKYCIVLFSPDKFSYYYCDFTLLKEDLKIDETINSMINFGKIIEKESNIFEESGKKYILRKQ